MVKDVIFILESQVIYSGIEVSKMKLSTKGRYGLKAMYELAKNGSSEPLSLKHIAEKQHISENYLEQLMAQLKKAHLVNSIRGAYGGYTLAKDPKDISVGEVVVALEGPIAITECSLEKDSYSCDNVEDCVLRPLWEKISESLKQTFYSVTVKDLVDQNIEIKS